MMELCFDPSTGGGLRAAQRCADRACIIATGGVVRIQREEMEETPQIKELRRKAEERFRRVTEARKNTVSLGGDPEDVLCLPLALSVGAIREPLAEDASRQALLRRWIGDEALAERSWRRSLDAVKRLEGCGAGDRVRIWVDQTPDSLCGLLFAAGLLAETGAEAGVVFLPPWRELPDGTLVQHMGWNGVAPEEFGCFLHLERPLTPHVLRMLAHQWRALRDENAPLRAMINGNVRSVGEDFYDGLIRKALPTGQKKVAQVIGDIIGREHPGVSDSLLADRIRALLRQGEYRLVREDPEIFYRSVIEKV